MRRFFSIKKKCVTQKACWNTFFDCDNLNKYLKFFFFLLLDTEPKPFEKKIYSYRQKNQFPKLWLVFTNSRTTKEFINEYGAFALQTLIYYFVDLKIMNRIHDSGNWIIFPCNKHKITRFYFSKYVILKL